MHWALYGQTDDVPLTAFSAGLKRHGFTFEWRDHDKWLAAGTTGFDAVAIHGMRHQGQDIRNLYQSRGVPVVVLDHGYMRRVNVLSDYATGYFQVGLNRLGWVPRAATSSDRFDALDVHVSAAADRPIRKALICGQVEYDASHNLSAAELEATYEELARGLEARGLSVSFRGHPAAKLVRPKIKPDGVRTLAQALDAADIIACLNSNAGLDALIAGKPVIRLRPSHYDPLSYAWPVPLPLVRAPNVARVTEHLVKLAYAQWTATEISRGDALAFLLNSGELHGQT